MPKAKGAPMITHVVQARCFGLGWVDASTHTSEWSARDAMEALKSDDDSWINRTSPRELKVVTADQARCAYAYAYSNGLEAALSFAQDKPFAEVPQKIQPCICPHCSKRLLPRENKAATEPHYPIPPNQEGV